MRTAFRRLGLPVPFGGVICTELTRTIYVESDWRARVVTRRALVFSASPVPGDLRDQFPIEPGSPLEILFYDSPDAMEVGRRRRGPRTLDIQWLPKQPVTRYTLYRHEDTWVAPESQKKSAIWAQFRCDMKMGVFSIEFVTPGLFEAGIVFRKKRWRNFRTERGFMKYALAQLKRDQAAQAHIDEGGKRATWQIEGPLVGDRFVFVLFHEHGMADWDRRITEHSLAGRARRLFGQFAHALGR
jgi:hypothetical protein